MTNTGIRLSVVIPTRERAETLLYTLKTVVAQDYDNLQILVSDNCSQDATKDIVSSFQDPRITYVNTGKRLGMSSNWEFAFQYVDGDYVTYLGDDDGLLRSCCLDVSNIICDTNTEAFVWRKAEYSWPSSAFKPNSFWVSLENKLLNIDSKLILSAVANGTISYSRLPVIYSGFISKRVLNKIKQFNGKLINSVTPDVYLGVGAASQVKNYIYSTRAFSVNGGSGKSNGQSLHRKDDFSNIFYSESDLPVNKMIPNLKGSVSACVAEAYLNAEEIGLISTPRLNKKKYIKRIYDELSQLTNDDIRNKALSEFQELPLVHNIKFKPNNKNLNRGGGLERLNRVSDTLSINLEPEWVSNVSEAVSFCQAVLGDYEMPRISNVDIYSVVLDICATKLCGFANSIRVLPSR